MDVAKQLFPPSPGHHDAQQRKKLRGHTNGNQSGSYRLGCRGAVFSLLLCLIAIFCTALLNGEWMDGRKEGEEVAVHCSPSWRKYKHVLHLLQPCTFSPPYWDTFAFLIDLQDFFGARPLKMSKTDSLEGRYILGKLKENTLHVSRSVLVGRLYLKASSRRCFYSRTLWRECYSHLKPLWLFKVWASSGSYARQIPCSYWVTLMYMFFVPMEQ